MTWDYLPELDKRMEVVAEFLNGKTKDQNIVDLDCLEARLLKYIDHDFNSYVGNDLLDKFPDCEKCKFYKMDDYDFKNMIKACDILCVFGYGGYELDKNRKESSTLSQSMNYVIMLYKPKYIIRECIKKYDYFLDDIGGYKQVLRESLDLGDNYLFKREIRIDLCTE